MERKAEDCLREYGLKYTGPIVEFRKAIKYKTIEQGKYMSEAIMEFKESEEVNFEEDRSAFFTVFEDWLRKNDKEAIDESKKESIYMQYLYFRGHKDFFTIEEWLENACQEKLLPR
jgi:hypothetical protein